MSEQDIPEPAADINMLTALDVTMGAPVSALDRMRICDSGGWEDITLELVSFWKTQYSRVVRCGSGGDMGRDVIAYTHGKPDVWENFQCKHYQNKLNLAQGLLEIAKLFYYAQRGEFSLPTRYYFVAPQGVSNDFLCHLNDPKKLKSALIFRWDKDCGGKITTKKGQNIDLSGGFLAFVESADFSIFDHIPPIKVFELHSNTPFHAMRFGSNIKRRPHIQAPPENISENEVVYTTELLRAFADADGVSTMSASSLLSDSDYKEEYDSARKNFYAAENLQKFSRDWLPDNSYQELVDECFEAVSSIVKGSFDNGYARYLATNSQAVNAVYVSHPLNPYIKIQDKKGFCHQLVNSRRMRWVKD